MTPSAKNGERGLLNRLLDSFLLAKSFEYQVDWTPEEGAKRLRELNKSKRGFFFALSREAKVTVIPGEGYDFEIRMDRYGRGLRFNTAKAMGTVRLDWVSENIIVRGIIRMAMITVLTSVWIIIAIILALTQLTDMILRDPLFPILLFIVYLLYILTMVSDYGKLYYLLHDIFSTENDPPKKKKER